MELIGNERYSVSKLKKRFDGLKKSSYLCKRNREESKKVPEVRVTRLSHQMVWNPDDSSLSNMVVVAQEPKRFTVEQGSEQSCASGSTPLPTTNLLVGVGTNLREQWC